MNQIKINIVKALIEMGRGYDCCAHGAEEAFESIFTHKRDMFYTILSLYDDNIDSWQKVACNLTFKGEGNG